MGCGCQRRRDFPGKLQWGSEAENMARYKVGLETRERILESTRDLLGEVGFEGTTLKAISQRAEVGAGSFYNLFESKEDVILEVIRGALARVDPDPSGLGQESIDDLIDAFVTFITGETAVIARIYLQMAGAGLADPAMGRAVLRSHRARVERYAAAIARAHPELSLSCATEHAQLLLGALLGYAVMWQLDPDFDFRRHADRLPQPSCVLRCASA
jgi:AcrR family transcriptional regulator